MLYATCMYGVFVVLCLCAFGSPVHGSALLLWARIPHSALCDFNTSCV